MRLSCHANQTMHRKALEQQCVPGRGSAASHSHGGKPHLHRAATSDEGNPCGLLRVRVRQPLGSTQAGRRGRSMGAGL